MVYILRWHTLFVIIIIIIIIIINIRQDVDLDIHFLPCLIFPSKVFQTVFHYSVYNVYFTIFFGPSFIIVRTSGLCLSHLKKKFITVKRLKAEINVNAQYVYMTASTGYCWIVVYLIFTVDMSKFDMYRCVQNSVPYLRITVSHFRLKCTKFQIHYLLRKYIRRNYL